ncbi:hypothetical protein [Halobacteriovorax sp. DA5]|uniref:hypothetical protein n=1 Tax=Halobacteriovorax sp. DA5 TaxID=2067553 RepID=UPI000CD26C65|nr:hypothetical protein [Halobacteriovorax sp. DA5]POB15001.1 hypothetical protein C0Z22_01085 [Halobacteriovorax sp. DA5]
MGKTLKLLFITLLSINVLAFEKFFLGQSPRAMLMGNAWMGLANQDSFTVFYNPASLGANYDVDISPVNFILAGPNAIDDMDRFNNLPSDAAGIADQLMGYPLYLEASNFSTIKAHHFSFSYFTKNRANIVLKNRVNPAFNVDYSYDRGFIAGFAFNLIGGSRNKQKKKIMKGKRLSLGYSFKYLTREGTRDKFDIFSTNIITKIENGLGSIDDIKNTFGYSQGSGAGHDIGIEYANGWGNTEFVASMAVLDIGDTYFKKTQGDGEVPRINMAVNTGIAVKQDWKAFDYSLALDVKPINQGLSFGRMIHFGAQLNIPFFGFFAGLGEGYLNYGAEIRLWPVTITAGFNNVEIGSEYQETKGDRLFVFISLFDTSMDIF